MRRSLFALLCAIGLLVSVPATVQAIPSPFTTIYVSTNGSDTAGTGTSINPYLTVSRGIDMAPPTGSTVLVGPGTFAGGVTMRDGVSLKGSGRGQTTLQGGGPVISVPPIGGGETISGFTISGGSFSYGAGISSAGGSPIIEDNSFVGNGAGSSWGGAIGLSSSSATIRRNLFTGNLAYSGSAIRIDGSSPSITDNVIWGNTSYVGAVRVVNSSPWIANNTIVGNNAGSGPRAGIYVSNAPLVIHNCIVWGNGDDLVGEAVSLTADYSCIGDGDAGTGNISAAPSFVDTATANLKLRFGSPCINTGLNANASAKDFDGVARPQNVTADMGAFEYGTVTDPTLSSTTHPKDTWEQATHVTVDLAGAAGTVSSLGGYAISWSADDPAAPALTSTDGAATTAYSFDAPSDGTYYVNVATTDALGNWSEGTNYGPILVDTTAPTEPTLASSSHTVDMPSRTTAVQLSFTGATDDGSGVDGYSVLWSQVADEDAPQSINESNDSTTSAPLADGEWYAHVRVVDAVGNWTGTSHMGPFIIGISTPVFSPTTTDGRSAVDMTAAPLDAASTMSVAGDVGTAIPGVASATVVGHDVLRVTFDAGFAGDIDIPVTVTTGTDVQAVHALITVIPSAPYSVTFRTETGTSSGIRWAGSANATGYAIFVNDELVGTVGAGNSYFAYGKPLGPYAIVSVMSLGGKHSSARVLAMYTQAGSPVRIGKVAFSGNSANLSPAAKRNLRALATLLAAQGYSEVTIDGYTASHANGSWAFRKKLSAKRANIVKAFLAKELSRRKATVKITIRARGGASPIGSPSSLKNRRAEIILN